MPMIIAPTASYDAEHTQPVREKLFQVAQTYLSEDELILLEKACAYAFHAHYGVNRKSGEPYITHPIAVAIELAQWGMDVQTLCAGLMHDVLEDVKTISHAQMEAEFGKTITAIVEGVSKLDKVKFTDKDEHKAESFQKLILAMVKDVRVIIVKLADRLHNMRTLSGVPKISKRRSTAQETLDIYANIANRLGMNMVYRELQDLSFANMYPMRHLGLFHAMERFRYNRSDMFMYMERNLQERFQDFNLKAEIKFVPKGLYGIYRKMKKNKLTFNKVRELYNLQIVVDTVSDCYLALGAVHSVYKPTPGRIKDLIAIPKSNGYQGVHTTLALRENFNLEVQIRTRKMDAVAKYGITANLGRNGDHAMNEWLQNVSDLQENSANALEFLEIFTNDLFSREVYALTPRGDVVSLPFGSTPVDFAYAVHTDVGNRCVASRIDDKLVPLSTVLRSGNKVEIITSKEARPSPAWLNFAKSGRARTAIRNYVKNTSRADAVQLGGVLLAKALDNVLPKKVASSEQLMQHYLDKLKENESSLEEVQYQIGTGQMLPIEAVRDIAELAGEYFDDAVFSSIRLSGNHHIRIRLGECCRPVAGDAVHGVISEGKGLVVHRDHCPELLKTPPEQQLETNWGSVGQYVNQYDAEILVSAKDGHALLADISSAISSVDSNIVSVQTVPMSQVAKGMIEFRFVLNVRDLAHLDDIIARLKQIPNVQRAERI